MNATPDGRAVTEFQPYKIAIALSLIAAAIFAWWQVRLPVSTNIPRRQSIPFNQFNADNESAWMARQIGQNIAETVSYAGTHKHPTTTNLHFESGTTYNGTKHRFTVRFDGFAGKEEEVNAVVYFWSPSGFASWTSKLLRAANVQAPTAGSDANLDLLSALTTPTAKTLIREDKRLSQALAENPLDPELHDEAALLIGSFAMREVAGASFRDIRRHLCKMTAHLALAQAVRENRGLAGDLAEAVLCSLTGREIPALLLVDRLQQNAWTTGGASADAVAIWGRALRLHNTGDYRELAPPVNASLLERLEYVRALRMSAGNAAASKFVMSNDLEPLPEWGEQILLGDISVGDGHWSSSALMMELNAIAANYRQYFDQQIADGKLIDALNVTWEQFPHEDSGKTTLHVLGWGAWAEQHQRQWCTLIRTTSCWLGDLLGARESATEFENEMTTKFSGLRLFPSIHFYSRTPERCKAWIEQIRKGFTQHRESLTYRQWSDARLEQQRLFPQEQQPVQSQPDSSPHRRPKMQAQEMEQLRRSNAPKPDVLFTGGSWWAPGLPFGTLFDLSNRGGRGALSGPGEVEAAFKLAPHNREVISAHLTWATRPKPTPEQTEAAFSELTGYDISAMKIVAEAFIWDPARYAEKFGVLCRFDPDRYVDLGTYHLRRVNEAGAVEAFQNAFDRATDRVLVSNAMDWLVNYYFEHERIVDAYNIAKQCADVSSQAGLVVFANLLDRMSQVKNAETYFKRAYEGYPESSIGNLFDFYAKHHDKSPAYAAEQAKLLPLIFPEGVQHVTVSDFQGEPKDGVTLTVGSPRTEKASLKTSDIIVAVNGCRVHNIQQYTAARAPSTNANAKFILWRAGGYLEFDSYLPEKPDSARMRNHGADPE